MGLLGSIDDARAGTGFIAGPLCLARHGKGHEVRRRTAAAQASFVAGTTHSISQPGDDGAFDRDGGGRRPPGCDILVESGREEFGERADRLAGARNIAEEAAIGDTSVLGDGVKVFQHGASHARPLPSLWKSSLWSRCRSSRDRPDDPQPKPSMSWRGPSLPLPGAPTRHSIS